MRVQVVNTPAPKFARQHDRFHEIDWRKRQSPETWNTMAKRETKHAKVSDRVPEQCR